MALNVLEFLAHPGRRFAVHDILPPVADETDDLRVVGEVRLDGEGFAQLSTLYLDVEIAATIAQPCGRCLKPLERPFTVHESFTVSIPPTAEEVDVRPAVVSLVLSAHNGNVFCRPDCRGLCPTCGADLNAESRHVCARRGEESRRLGDFLRP